MAGRQKFTVDQVADALKSCRGLIFLTAKKLGCCVDTVRDYCKRYPKIAEVAVSAKGEMVDLAEAKLYDAIRKGAPWAICFFLKTQAKDRGYLEKVETETSARLVIREIVEVTDDTSGA
jgi:hypothetical protein